MKVIKSEELSRYDTRYVIVDDEGNILDDAQGYGYKSARNAHAAWAYKNRTPAQKKKANQNKKKIQEWVKSHPQFMDNLEATMIDYMKEGEELDNKTIKKWLLEEDPTVDFGVREFLKYM